MPRRTMKKSTPRIQELPLKCLENFGKVIAFSICFGLLLTSSFIVIDAYISLFTKDYQTAIQDGLFVLILLEMFYVTRSFMRFGSINVSIVVNVGIIASVKALIFELDKIDKDTAIAFGVIFVTLGFTYFMEKIYFEKTIKKPSKEEA